MWLRKRSVADHGRAGAKHSGRPPAKGCRRVERPETGSEDVGHGFDDVGGRGQSQLWVPEVGAEAVELAQKVSHDHAHAKRRPRLRRQPAERLLQLGQALGVARPERLADAAEDRFPPDSRRQVLVPAPAPVELREQVEVAALVDPALRASQPAGAPDAIRHQGFHPGPQRWRDSQHGVLPAG